MVRNAGRQPPAIYFLLNAHDGVLFVSAARNRMVALEVPVTFRLSSRRCACILHPKLLQQFWPTYEAMRRLGSLKPLRKKSPSGRGLDLSRSVASPWPAEASWPLSRRAEQLAPCRLCHRCALTIERLILVLASRWTVPQTFKIGGGCFWMGNHPAHFMRAAVVSGAREQTCPRPTSLQVGPR